MTANAAELGLNRAAYGVCDRYGAYDKAVYPFLNTTEFTTGWEVLNTAPGVYNWTSLDAALQRAYDNNQPIVVRFLPVGLSWSAPEWLKTDLGIDRFTDGTFNYANYKDPKYPPAFRAFVLAFGNHLRRELPARLVNNIACVRVEIGATSDPEPFNGPVPSQYYLSHTEWYDFSKYAFTAHIDAFHNGTHRKIPLRFSTNEVSTPGLWEWCLANTVPGLRGTKFGGEVRGHHLTGSGSSVAEMKPMQVDSNDGVFTVNEMDKTWRQPFFQRNLRLGFYWAAVEQLNGGLSIWDVEGSSLEACYGTATTPPFDFAFTFFNLWATELIPSTARGGFCIFHEGLNSADTVKFPERIYGPATQGNTGRYTAICAAYASQGAKMDDVDSARKGQVYQRANQDGFNDAGWDIVSGNYDRHITQINADTTSLALWRVRGDITLLSDPYDRFARRFDRATGKNAMFFDVNYDLTPSPGQRIQLSVTYLDQGTDKFGLFYDAVGDSRKRALTVTKSNTNTWKTATVTVTDWVFNNNGPFGSDLELRNLGTTGNTTFHGIELVKLVDVRLTTVGQGTVAAKNEGLPVIVSGLHAQQRRLEMVVTPAAGWKFSHWSGAMGGNNDRAIFYPTDVITNLTATFVRK